MVPPTTGGTALGGGDQKPGLIMAMALLYLIPGVISVFWALSMAALSWCLWVPWIAEIVAGIGGIVAGAKMLGNPPGAPMKWVSIMMIITVLDCNIFTMTAGILTLVFMANVEVKQYYANRGINY